MVRVFLQCYEACEPGTSGPPPHSSLMRNLYLGAALAAGAALIINNRQPSTGSSDGNRPAHPAVPDPRMRSGASAALMRSPQITDRDFVLAIRYHKRGPIDGAIRKPPTPRTLAPD